MLHKQFILHYFQYNLVFSLTTFRFDDRFNRKKHAGYSGYIIAEIPVDHTSFIESLRTLAGCFSSTLFLCNPRIFLWDFGQDCFQVIPSSWPWYSWTFFVSAIHGNLLFILQHFQILSTIHGYSRLQKRKNS